MRLWMFSASALLLTACSSMDTVQDPLSWHCQHQLDAAREQPAPRDRRADRPPVPIAPISADCEREMRRGEPAR
ncbi:hypothetical protein D3C87_355820 [compost metagenome]